MTKPAGDLEMLLGLLHEAFDARAWHGPSLRTAVRGVDARLATWRPAPGRHNIWETVVHAAFWKYAVRRRLTGDKSRTFPIKGHNWFVRPANHASAHDAAWKDDVRLLIAEHRRLVETVAGLTPSSLRRPSRGSRQTPLFMIRGIAAHDLYHAGQVQLLRALARP